MAKEKKLRLAGAIGVILLIICFGGWIVYFATAPSPALPHCTSPDGRYQAFVRFSTPRGYVVRPAGLYPSIIYGSGETLSAGEFLDCRWGKDGTLTLSVSKDAVLSVPSEFESWENSAGHLNYRVRIVTETGTLVKSLFNR